MPHAAFPRSGCGPGLLQVGKPDLNAADFGDLTGAALQGSGGHQRGIGVLALGNVHVCAQDARGPARSVALDHHGVAQHPDPMAVLVQHAVLQLIGRSLALGVG